MRTYFVLYPAPDTTNGLKGMDGPWNSLLDAALVAQELGGTILHRDNHEVEAAHGPIFHDARGRRFNSRGERLLRLP